MVILKIKAVKNFNGNMTKRQQSFISLILKHDFTYQIKSTKNQQINLINQSIQSQNHQNSKESVIFNFQWVQWPALISHCNQSSVQGVD